MNNHLNSFLFVAISTLLLASCSEDNTSYITPSTSGIAKNSGVISQKNFSLLTADTNPAVIDATENTFTQTEVELTVHIGDRKNQTLTDAHTVYFKSEYGLVEPSCITKDGSCSVMWNAIKEPTFGGPGSDGFVTITAYTSGEESFTDSNGNNLYDDGDTGFSDLEEPYVDTNENNLYNVGDDIIDVVNAFDTSGANNSHDPADGFFNGSGCTHSFLCSPMPSIVIFDDVTMSIVSNIQSRTIGGTVAGLNITSTGQLELHNGTDNLTITANGDYTFPTTVDDGQTYAVTVTNPTNPGQICTPTNDTGTVSANVTNVDVTCAAVTYTIGGTISGVGPGTETIEIRNGGDALIIAADSTYTFPTQIADGAGYAVTIFDTPDINLNCTFTNTNATGNIMGANIGNVDINCAP